MSRDTSNRSGDGRSPVALFPVETGVSPRPGWRERAGAGAALVVMSVVVGIMVAAALVAALVFVGLLASAALN